ncbi:thiol reductant ABC exporter subunit CydC [Roseibium sp.]|uniref:thiol reductant ABC exporter subunit CydC n=1 Tax=Roseibium sp. TaxID=1936156 RepID=UPI003266CA0B
MRAVREIIRAQFRHDRVAFMLAILVALLPAAAGLLLLGVSGWFITAAAIAGLTGAFLNIFVPSALIRGLAILRTGGRYGERVLTHDATFRFLANLRNQVFTGFTASRKRGVRSGLLLNRLTLDIAALDTVYLRIVVPAALAAVLAPALLWWWAGISVPVLITGIAFLSAWAMLAWLSFARADRKAARRADAALEAMRLRTADLVAGRRDLAIYGGLEVAAQAVLSAGERLEAAEDTEERRILILGAVSGLIGQVFLAAALAVAIWGAASGEIGAALAVALVLVVMALPEVAALLLPGLSRLPRIALAADRTVGLLGDTGAVDTGTADTGTADTGPQDEPGEFQREGEAEVLAFRDVSFGYPGARRDVLEKLSFHIDTSEVVAISGPSGCGKSTVAALSARMLTPETGRILLQGRNLADIPEATLRGTVTVLGQRPYLFNDTVAANLRIARAEASDAELWTALEQAALSERIAGNALGLETVLGEGGIGLSGGEQRRLALARAMLTQPALFILDEMTEGLDARTAAEVLDRFFAARGTAAVLMIAHKRRELSRADRIVRFPVRSAPGASRHEQAVLSAPQAS